MQYFQGSAALSRFRHDKLLEQLKSLVPEITAVSAAFVHFVDSDVALDGGALDIVEKLLTYGPKTDSVDAEGELFLVTPRAGTISPWSSKAGSETLGMLVPDRVSYLRSVRISRSRICSTYSSPE